MSKIDELKRQLQEAEKAEKLEYLQKELKLVQTEYENKCFGSHTFTRKSVSSLMGAIHYEKFFIRDSKIYVHERAFHLNRYDSTHKVNKTDVNFDRHHYERVVYGDEGNNYTASYNTFSRYSFYRKEISLLQFELLWSGLDECNQIIKSLFENNLPDLKTESISQGNHDSEQRIDDSIKIIGLDIIDFKNYPRIHNYIEYVTLPMFQDRRWMPRIFAKQILEYHVNTLIKQLNEPLISSRIFNAVQSEIEVINNFINEELK